MRCRVIFLHVNTDDRQMYAEYLASEGMDVTQVATTDGALPLIADADVVVTGLQIPGSIHPLQLIAKIRREPATAGLPVIVVTACGFSDWLHRAKDEGADAVLLKPCLPSVLLAEIRQAVASRTGDVRAVVKPDRRQVADRRAEGRGGRRAGDAIGVPRMAKVPPSSRPAPGRRRAQ
jgi:CheY-like chemotaxis protein